MKLILFFLLIAFVGCQTHATKESTPGKKPDGLLPEISQFLDEHKEFGEPVKIEPMPDWAKGRRQRVEFDTKRNLLFYTKDGKVATVYEDSGERKIVWGKTE